MVRSCVLMPLLLAAVSGTCLGANEFSYQIKVGTGAWSAATNFNANTATTINVGTVGGSDVYLRIYDNNTATLNDLGRITITGTSGAGSGRLKIAIWNDTTVSFPGNPTTPIGLVGAASWDGLTFNDPGSGNNTNLSLLKRADLAASIRDNLTGNVDVGRVFTLQVNGTLQVSGAVVGGNIDAQVRAWSEDEFAPSPAFDDPPSIASVEYVRAGNRITKKIIAGDTDQSSEGYVGSDYDTIEELLQYELSAYPKGDWLGRGASIRRVVIGPSTQSEGMINDGGLDASTGRIYRLTSTGKIGEPGSVSVPSSTATITAGFGAYTIRQTDESGAQVVNPGGHDWLVNVQAAKYFTAGNILGNPTLFSQYSVSTGAINLMETTGSITGPINAANLTGQGSEPMRRDAHGHSGIICGGALRGVTITQNVYYANILADSLESVSIGRSLIGAVVAYGTGGGPGGMLAASGEIADLSAATSSLPAWSDPYPWMAQGFIGCDVAPLDMAPGLSGDPTSSVTAWGYDPDRWLYRSGGDAGCDSSPQTGAAVDSVVRAEVRIYKSSIGFMTQRLGKCAPEDKDGRLAAYRPRVESPLLQDTSIGIMEAGVVWSGRLNYSSGTLANLREDDYTTGAERAEFHTIGPAADVWWKSVPGTYPFDTNLFIIGDPADTTFGYGHGGVLGEVHVPTLPTSAYVLIEGGIGDTNDADAIGLFYDPIGSTEDSPRGRRLISSTPGDIEPHYVPAGIIRVDSNQGTTYSGQDGGLNGQVVLGSTGTGVAYRAGRDDFWKGQVRIGDAFAVTPLIVVLDPALNTPGADHQQYEYATPAADLGQDTSGGDNGGAVGVASFELHASDCLPPTKGSFLTPPAVADILPAVAPMSVWSGSLRTRFYGPVIDQSSDGAAVSIESSVSGTFTTDRVSVTSQFDIVVVGGSSLADQQERDVLISGKCGETYDAATYYRVVRAQDSIDGELPGQLLGAWPGYNEDVQPFAHYFRLVCNMADFGTTGGVPGPDGVLDNNDFIVFISYFFASDPRADMGTTGGVPGSDGAWDNNDFIVFINYFFADDCNGAIIGPCGFRGMAGRESEGGGGGGGAERAAMIRAALTVLIENETDEDRRRQLQEMLDGLP